MPPDLIKSAFLLERASDTTPESEYVLFQAAPDTEAFIGLPVTHWEDMGSPSEITVTVEPGDTLNEDDGHKPTWIVPVKREWQED